MEKQKTKKSGILLTIAGGICWGISGCFGQYMFQEKGVTAEWLVSIRLLSAGILLLLIGYIHQGKERMHEVFRQRADLKKLFLHAECSFVNIPILLQYNIPMLGRQRYFNLLRRQLF